MFENKPEATDFAFDVTIIDTLDSDVFNLSTIEVDTFLTMPRAGKFIWSLDGNVLTFKFIEIALPPNKVPPEGEWQAVFSIKLKSGATVGTRIDNYASITFDDNPPIITPAITHIVGAPLISSSRELVNFGNSEINVPKYDTVWVKNVGDIPLNIDNIHKPNRQFTIIEDNCSGKMINTKDSASLILRFTPDASDLFKDTIWIPSSDLSNYPFIVRLIGYGPGVNITELNNSGNYSWIYPNPFSESTTIIYELQTADRVKIDIYNSLGSKITTLVDEWQGAGRHNCELLINNYELSSGIYYYKIQIGDRIESGKLILVR